MDVFNGSSSISTVWMFPERASFIFIADPFKSEYKRFFRLKLLPFFRPLRFFYCKKKKNKKKKGFAEFIPRTDSADESNQTPRIHLSV